MMATLGAAVAACSRTEPAAGGGAGGTGGARTGGSSGRGGTSGAGGNVNTGGSASTGGAVGGSAVDGGDTADVPAGDADAGPTVKLRIAWWGGMARQERTVKVIELFQQKYPHIGFEYASAPIDSTAYWLKYEADAVAGDLPDLMQHDHKYLDGWTTRGDLLALDDLVADGSLNLTDVAPALVDGGRIKGKLMGLNLGSNTQAMIVDVDAFTKAGVALPTDSWTWEDFQKIVTDLKTKSMPSIWGYGLSIAADGIWKSLYLSEGTGGWVFNPSNTALGYTDDKPLVDHLTMALALQKAGAITTRTQQAAAPYLNTTDVSKYPIVMGLSAMEYTSGSNLIVATWVAAEAASMAPRKLKMYPVPRRKGGVASIYIKPSQYFSITSKSKYAKEAAMFLDFFTNSIEANEILGAERGAPVAAKVAAALKAKLDVTKPDGKGQAEAYDLLERVAKDARPLPSPDPGSYGSITKAYDMLALDPLLLTETTTPAAAAAAFRIRANEILAGGGTDGGVGDGGGDGGVNGGDGGVNGGVDGGGDASGDGAAGKHVMLVVGAVPLVGNDLAVEARVKQKVPVDVVLETAATSAMAADKAAVIISATSSLLGVDTKFRDIAVPVIVMEPNLLAPMKMVGDAVTDRGTVADQTQLTIVATNNPLTAGLTGNVTVYSAPYRMVYGLPGGDAVKIATIVGSTTQSPIFYYPAGVAMVGQNAPAKRLSFFIHNSATANVAENGLKLLDAVVDWAIAP